MNQSIEKLRHELDETRRKLAECDKKLQLLIRHSPSATAIFDREMRYIAFSNRWILDYGIENSEIVGKSHYEIFPDIPDRWKAIHQQVLAGSIEKCDEDCFRRADGSSVWVRWEIHPWLTGDERIGGLIIYSEVITGRKLAELHKKHFRDLLDNTNDGIEVLDKTTLRFVDMNETECQVLGYSREELLSLSIPDIVPAFNWERHRIIMDKIQNFGHVRIESVRQRKDGTRFPVEVSIKLVDLEHAYLVCIVSDITDRKISEKTIARHKQLYVALSQCNQAIVRCKNEKDLFEEACRVAVQFGGMKLAWIGLIDPTTHTVRPAASFGYKSEILQDLAISIHETGLYGASPTAISIRENRAYWCQNFSDDPATLSWRKINPGTDWAASASLPLHRNGRIVGAFVLYSDVVNVFDELTRDLLLEMATDISFALDIFDREYHRKMTEEALRDSESRLRMTTEMSNIAIWEYDVKTDQMTRSANHDQLYGLPWQDIWYSATFLNATHPDDRDRAWETIHSSLAPGGSDTYAFDFRVTRPDKSISWLWVKGTVIKRDSEGNGTVVRGVLIDVTERIHAREALTESQKRLEFALQAASMGVWSLDLVSNIRYLEDQTCRLLGIDPDKFTGTAEEFFKTVHPDDLESLKDTLAHAIDKNSQYESEYRVVWPDGSVHYIAGRGRIVRDDQGRPLKIQGIAFDVTDWKHAQNQILTLAFYDPLTRLPNRRLLLDRLQHALAASSRNGRAGAILFVDLDNFKSINDTLGHARGDLLLQQTAERLTSCVRAEDTVARIGGDEFVVMLEDLSDIETQAATQTETIGLKILSTLTQPYQIASREYRGTCSIGMVLFSNRHHSTDELLKQADIAMYQAKKAGRNTLRFFDTEMQEIVTARAFLEVDLRKALENHQFQLHYQIQVDSSLKVIGAEALIRWVHPKRGTVSPAEFIPLSEETGLILPIGHWVLETACSQIKAWQQDESTRELVLSVNVSAREFRQTDFVPQVKAAIQRHGINPKLLKLELTESLLLENIEGTISVMNTLNKIGVQFSLDDFGTGYSSLQYLKRLPLDQIKIDQSFVRDIAEDSSDKAIVRTIIAMANSLNLDVIAEGVETEVQRQLLFHKGCTHYQGYLFGKPVPIEQFEVLVKQVLKTQ